VDIMHYFQHNILKSENVSPRNRGMRKAIKTLKKEVT
jgi:hypothetical protein